jgi:hypothetical protein
MIAVPAEAAGSVAAGSSVVEGSVAAGSVAAGGSVTTGGCSVAGGPPPQAARIMLARTTSDTKKLRLCFTVLLLREWFE